MPKLILITGGARSGKSSYALKLAKTQSRKVVYIATATPLDSEMRKRIKLHRKLRRKNWITIEEPIDILSAVKRTSTRKTVIILDCLTLLISNLMLKGFSDNVIYNEIKTIVKALKANAQASIVVTNEIGSGIVPDNKLARRFRDIQGCVNQLVSEEAERVYLLVSGIPVKIKGGRSNVERIGE